MKRWRVVSVKYDKSGRVLMRRTHRATYWRRKRAERIAEFSNWLLPSSRDGWRGEVERVRKGA